MSERLPKTHCLACGYQVDAASPVDGTGTPEPGSISVCFKCAAVAKYGDDLTIVPLQPEDIEGITSDPGFCGQLVRTQRAILAFHAQQN